MLVFYWRFSGLNAIAVICPPEPFVPVRRRNSRGNHVVLGGLRFRLRKHAATCAAGDRPASRFARRMTPSLSPPGGCLRDSRVPCIHVGVVRANVVIFVALERIEAGYSGG